MHHQASKLFEFGSLRRQSRPPQTWQHTTCFRWMSEAPTDSTDGSDMTGCSTVWHQVAEFRAAGGHVTSAEELPGFACLFCSSSFNVALGKIWVTHSDGASVVASSYPGFPVRQVSSLMRWAPVSFNTWTSLIVGRLQDDVQTLAPTAPVCWLLLPGVFGSVLQVLISSTL